jgi:hypothetical protein
MRMKLPQVPHQIADAPGGRAAGESPVLSKSHNLTADLPASFVRTEDDHTVDQPPTFPIGWTKNGAFVLLSDGWDIRQVPARGGPGTNLTLDGKSGAFNLSNC